MRLPQPTPRRTATTFTNGPLPPSPPPTIQDILSAADAFREIISPPPSTAELCNMQCADCGRRPIFSSGALQVCACLWERMKKYVGFQWPPNDRQPRLGLLAGPLAGIRIELLDDGPARFDRKWRGNDECGR